MIFPRREEASNKDLILTIIEIQGFLSRYGKSHTNWHETLNEVIARLEQEPTTKNDLGVDYISRAQAQTEIEMNASRYTIARERGGMGQVEWSDQLIKVSDAVDIIRDLPSVTPQEPKQGHWIYDDDCHEHGHCSECGTKEDLVDGKIRYFCRVCGARMESEDDNT